MSRLRELNFDGPEIFLLDEDDMEAYRANEYIRRIVDDSGEELLGSDNDEEKLTNYMEGRYRR